MADFLVSRICPIGPIRISEKWLIAATGIEQMKKKYQTYS